MATTTNEASLPGRSDGSILHYTGWTKKAPNIYLKGDTVHWSASWEFPPGHIMSPEAVKDAQARGYNIIVLSESTTTSDVATVEPSAAPKKRPIDLFIMLNEIDVGKISDIDRLKDFIYLCDAALNFLDDEFALDAETRVFVNMPESNFIAEGLKHHKSSTADRIKAAKRYRNRRQFILRRKREAGQKATAKVIAMKMALSRKTPMGKPKKENNVSDSIDRHGWLGRGTTFAEFMKPASDENLKELREDCKTWLKENTGHKQVITVTYLNKQTGKQETVPADIYAIRAIKEINALL